MTTTRIMIYIWIGKNGILVKGEKKNKRKLSKRAREYQVTYLLFLLVKRRNKKKASCLPHPSLSSFSWESREE